MASALNWAYQRNSVLIKDIKDLSLREALGSGYPDSLCDCLCREQGESLAPFLSLIFAIVGTSYYLWLKDNSLK